MPFSHPRIRCGSRERSLKERKPKQGLCGRPIQAGRTSAFNDFHSFAKSPVHIMNIATLVTHILPRIFCSRLARPFFALIAAVSLHSLEARAATVTTDLEDYAPFSFVQITGTGFQPGESVTNQVVQVEGPAAGTVYAPWTVTADADGGFHTTWYVFTDELIG